MDELNLAANTEQSEGIANPIDETTSTTEVQTEPVQTTQQDITQTQSFAKRLAEERSKLAAELEGKYNPYKSVLQEAAESYGFNTVEEYLEAYNQQKQQQELERQAQQMNASPEVLRELNELKQKIAAQEEEKASQIAKQEQAQWESQIKGQVNEVLELAKKDGVDITEEQLIQSMMEEGISDPKKAYKLMKPEVDIEALKKSAVEEYFVNLKKGNRPVEGGGASPVLITQQPKTFEDARKGAAEMLRASNIFK
jgi:valyl-tRNA synthetase